MQKIEFSQFGDPTHVLHVVNDDPGRPGAGEVLVDVEAAPVHPADLLMVRGAYGVRPRLPAVPGSEGVGRVAETGADVSQVKVGDLVLLPIGSGTWRSRMCVPADGLFPLPERSDPFQFALVSVNGLTARLLLSEIASLQPGDWVVQNAANSSVGQFIVIQACERGIKTANVVRRGGGIELKLKKLGANAVVVDRGQDLAEDLSACMGGGAALAVDAVGGPSSAALARALRDGGTLVNYGAMGEVDCHVSPMDTIFRDIRVRGFWLARWLRDNRTSAAGHVRDLVEGVAAGRLHAEIDGTYPLNRIREAVRQAGGGGRGGKVMLTPDAHW